ncbi:hypothetical protein JYU34_001880 [Plutella xylostella]|uniref:Sperm flagellar protein 2 n=1 Tax=Plutella xylostella TaxID=51655 RepID=A0ABQ7R507_PLUXY|nr:hypothetical protein JYU34_001880 [Plutella xylostella]
MAEILKEWLSERLQKTITWEADEFGLMMKDGNIIAKLLLNYKVISEEQFYLMRTCDNIHDVQNNWKYLNVWLHNIEIYLSDVDLHNVMVGKGSSLLRLFYKLFLHLDRRDRTDFIKKERKVVSKLVDKMEQRFKVDMVKEEVDTVVDDLSKPLLDEKHFIDWQKQKAEKLKVQYDYIRSKYKNNIETLKQSKLPLKCVSTPIANQSKTELKKYKKDMDIFAMKHPCKFENYTYEQLIELDASIEKRKRLLIDTDWASNYMEHLHTKLNNKTDSQEFQEQMRNVISGSLWDKSIADEETKFDNEIAKKVIKLSQFERQMCTQIMETKQQARNLTLSRIKAEQEFTEQRDQQFSQFLDNIKEQLRLEVTEIDFEKKRNLALHRKLYADRKKKKEELYYNICYETVLALVDYATIYSFHKKIFEGDVPKHFINEWKTTFFKHQPIFDVVGSMEDIFKDQEDEEEIIPEEDEIFRLEQARQEALNNEEFNEYHGYSGPWFLLELIPNFEPESEERRFEKLGGKIMAHVVYTLLDMKYPHPPARLPLDIPEYPVRSLLRGIPDNALTVPLQKLLDFRRIRVIRLETAIIFCLQTYKAEMVGSKDVEFAFDKLLSAAPTKESKDLVNAVMTEGDFIKKGKEIQPIGPIPPNTKQTQTPKTIPEEDIVLSTAAELGKYTYESLSFGETLTDYLLCAIIGEYIKNQRDINGFVIINYPMSYRQAQILEETFSGVAPPDQENIEESDDTYMEEVIMKHENKENDLYQKIRTSRLFSDPHKNKFQQPFQSYFTSYIKLKPTDDILKEEVIWNLTPENSELIDRFYSILGLNYSIYYEILQREVLSQICWYIIGDMSIPLDQHRELFGENVLSTLDLKSSDDKRAKSKTVKPEAKSASAKSTGKANKGKKSKKHRTSVMETEPQIEPELEQLIEPGSLQELLGEVGESNPENNEEILSTNISEDIKILPGDEDWEYVILPISEPLAISMATYWEMAEKAYIDDLEELFFAKRMVINSIVPYSNFLMHKINQIVLMSSLKQELVIAFQKKYNDFEDDWRLNNVAKAEWHCRVKELQTVLYSITDERKQYAESQKQELVYNNWTAEELTSLVNTYISCMQTELNRFFVSYQLMHDFYFLMIKNIPASDRISSKELTKIVRDVQDSPNMKKLVEDKVYKRAKALYTDVLMTDTSMDTQNNPFYEILEDNVNLAIKHINDANNNYRALISKEYLELAHVSSTNKKKTNLSGLDEITPEEAHISNTMKCLDEWTMGINGEMFRASLRIFALQNKCNQDLRLFNDHMSRTFNNIQNTINKSYNNEIKSIDRLCKYFSYAIEEGKKVHENVTLENDTLIIDPNILSLEKLETEIPKVEREVVSDKDFRMCQLAKLRDQFKICAPTGLALQQEFIYLLQDFVMYGKESCDGSMFPENWQKLDPENIPILVQLLFGDSAYIDWRDFLIYCMNIRYPTIDEILETRHMFRCQDKNSNETLSRDNFLEDKLWFEDLFDTEDSRAQLRKLLLKHFLFELFEISPNIINYSAFLLAFCKHADPIEGFSMAISLATGKKTCVKLDECEEVICKQINRKRHLDASLQCAHECAKEFIDTLIENVVESCEGFVVSEITNAESTSKSNKMEKKNKSKMKVSSSQSARRPKEKKVESKIFHSAPDVLSTYICDPCELPPSDKVYEEGIEETISVSVEEDPNIAYSVNQDVIWKVLEICLPWHFVLTPELKKTPYRDQVQQVMTILQNDTVDGTIHISKFVKEVTICKLLFKVKKFALVDFNHVIFELITQISPDSKEEEHIE